MSIQKNPLQALRDLTQKRIQVPKTEKPENFPPRQKPIRTNLSFETQLPDQEAFGDSSFQGDVRTKEKFFAKTVKPVFRLPGFQILKTEEVLNRISPGPRFPSRGSPDTNNIGLFPSKNKEKAEGDPTFLVKTRVERGLQYFSEENYQDALLHFSQAESLIERYCNLDKKIPFETIFLVFYNMVAANYK